MPKEVILRVRIPVATRKRLDRLATATMRNSSDLAADAINIYLRDQGRQLAQIDRGLADLAAGRTVPHERVAAWLRSWGIPDEIPPPKIKGFRR